MYIHSRENIEFIISKDIDVFFSLTIRNSQYLMYGTATSMLRTSPQQNTYENNNKSLTFEVVYNFAPARFNATTANGKEKKRLERKSITDVAK